MPAPFHARALGSAVLGLLAGLALPITADEAVDPLDDDRFWEMPQAESNRGSLAFLHEAPDEPVHHHENQITLQPSSLRDGWVELRQCHRDIDAVGRMQIVYKDAATRDLAIESRTNIEEAWVDGASVQMRQVRDGAEICVRARSQMLKSAANGEYVLENGPFMRRFLDGYFPMHVTVVVNWGHLDLSLARTEPAAQPGFEVTASAYGVIVEALFEGRLNTALHLVDAPASVALTREP